MAKHRVFFMCSTVIEVTEDIAKQIVLDGEGRFREDSPVMDEVLKNSGVGVLAYPTYKEWKEDHPDVEHQVVGDFNVAKKVSAKLGFSN
jgi:hypothetical protein